MDKKKLLLSLAAITGGVTGTNATTIETTKDDTNESLDKAKISAFKPNLKSQFVLKMNLYDWDKSEGVFHRSHSSHSSHRSHSSHSSHRSSTFV